MVDDFWRPGEGGGVFFLFESLDVYFIMHAGPVTLTRMMLGLLLLLVVVSVRAERSMFEHVRQAGTAAMAAASLSCLGGLLGSFGPFLGGLLSLGVLDSGSVLFLYLNVSLDCPLVLLCLDSCRCARFSVRRWFPATWDTLLLLLH